MTTTHTELSRALGLHQAGELGPAEEIYRQIIDVEPDNHNALNLLGVLLSQSGRPGESLEFLYRAAQAGDRFASGHFNYANALHAHGRLEDAEAQYRLAIEFDRELTSAHHNLGAILFESGRLDEAATCFRETVRTDPLHPEAWHQLAVIELNRQEADAAAECWRRAIEANPKCVDHHHNRGHALHVAGRLKESDAAYREAIRVDPRSVATRCNHAALLREMGRHEDAIESCEVAIRLDPKHADAHANLANIHLALGDFTAALSCADRALDIDPQHSAAMTTAGGALQMICEDEAALDHLDEAVRVEPQNPENYLKRADLLLFHQRLDEAERDCRTALGLAPDSERALLTLAKVCIADARRADALEILIPLAAPPRINSQAAIMQATVLRRMGQHESALKVLADRVESGELNSSHRTRALFGLADCCDRLKRYDEAMAWAIQANDSQRYAFDFDEMQGVFERILETFDAAALETLPRASVECDRGIFIVGMPRSGTTLIEQIMDSHPDMHGAGERDFFVPTAREMGKLTGDGSFPECVPRLSQANIDNLGESCVRRLAGFSPTHARVIEKTPTNFRFLGLLQMLLPGSRVIFCRRDPVDTCLSCYFQDFTGWHPYKYDLRTLGIYYRLHERFMAHWMDVLDLPVLEVNYEDLVAEQESVSRRIIEFSGLDWDENCLRFHENTRRVRSASAEQVTEPIYTSSVNRSRHYLKHLGPLLDALGLDAGE